MPLYRTYRKGELLVGVWKVEETIDRLRSMFVDFSLYESGLQRFKSEKRQLEWLAVRVLLKELLGEEKPIAYLPSGKPYLKDGSACISFSHTHGYVAVAVHPTKEVGIDIEQYGDRVCRLASRFVREDEMESVIDSLHLTEDEQKTFNDFLNANEYPSWEEIEDFSKKIYKRLY